MAIPSEPSYALVDFPFISQEHLRDSNNGPTATEPSQKYAAATETRVHRTHWSFKRKFMLGRSFADCVVTLLPIALLGVSIAIIRLDGKDIKKQEHQKWENGITIMASIFPILFASVVGRMLFECARWKLEKGVTLGLLEQLIGSRTVGSTLTTQFNLGKFNILGLLLLILWAFSPLGSQSVLRMLRTELKTLHEASYVLYFSTDAQSWFAEGAALSPTAGAHVDHVGTYIKTMYTSLFLTSPTSKANPMDLWGNVKIPNLDMYDDKWHNISSNPAPDSYSALIGLPIANITPGNVTFSVESSYIHLECSNFTNSDSLTIGNFNWSDPDAWDAKPKPNGTWYGHNRTELKTPWVMALDRFVDPFWMSPFNLSDRYEWDVMTSMYGRPLVFENETGLHVKPARLLFDSYWNYKMEHDRNIGKKTKCQVLQRYVESWVHCSRDDLSTPQNCSVTAQRLSRTKHATGNITMLSFERIWGYVSSLPSVMGGTLEYPDILMRYLNDPLHNDIHTSAVEEDKYLFKGVGTEQFGRRLSQVINTYLLVSQTYKYAMQADDKFESNVTVPVEVGNLVEVYAVKWSWMALFITSCVMLIASGIASVAFAHLAIGPEILGYASSAVRDSRYMDLPLDVGMKDALEVTKMIGQRRLKYGFVDSTTGDGQTLVGIGLEDEVGNIRQRGISKSSL
ncbi:hypothetical protein FGRMN_4377 [Fusarium graminum]|nr:hypothetical protein FGRMN_4377 [Fusarium graminum]